mmetsp:Transcript_19498/g.64619  ORF Transcript_19498/g.64619 Transcript_19498/m.64619 type:complete len:503 (-) Transcript_19498:165-1673(-)
MGGPRFLTSPADVGFLSKSDRLQQESREVLEKPGPGAYDLRSSFESDRRRTVNTSSSAERDSKRIIWYRAPTAPSIPRQDQAFGYEEGPNGQLVKQKPPIVTYAGDKKDMVGPGNYDPVLEPTRPKVRSFDFGRSKSARADLSFLTASEIPGPGAYSSRKQEEGTEVVPQRRKPTATFASRVLRPYQVKEKPVRDEVVSAPGPGSYKIPDSLEKARKKIPEHLQCFGSTSKRLAKEEKPFSTPGPGSYDAVRTSFNDLSSYTAPTMVRRSVPFLSSGTRFNGPVKEAPKAPGPGAYDEDNRYNFVAMLSKKRFSRGGNFGSTSKRFVEQASSQDEDARSPPVTYESKQPKQIQGKLKKGPISVLIAGTPRARAEPELAIEGPAPGQYYKSMEWGTGYKKPANGKTIFISQSQRFQDPSDKFKQQLPGPGTYSSDVMTLNSELQKLQKRKALLGEDLTSATFGAGPRFSMKAQATPGPGAYNAVDPYSQLIKRSFNITIEGSM